MKKILVSIVAIMFTALMITNVFAVPSFVPAVPCPPTNCGACPGFTPGFWKHNIQVRLSNEPELMDLTNGAYSAAYDTKMSDVIMDGFLVAIKGNAGMEEATFESLLAAMQARGPGSVVARTNAANWFNYVAGFDVFVD